MAKHFTLTISEGAFSYERNHSQIEQEALYDGVYILRTRTSRFLCKRCLVG